MTIYEPTYVAILRSEGRPLWSTESDSKVEAFCLARKQGLKSDEFHVVNTEDLED